MKKIETLANAVENGLNDIPSVLITITVLAAVKLHMTPQCFNVAKSMNEFSTTAFPAETFQTELTLIMNILQNKVNNKLSIQIECFPVGI